MEDPRKLLGRLKLGREEYCQRLLTMLILAAPYPRWNSRLAPSPQGLAFLRELDALSFGSAEVGDHDEFVDELDLPPRHDLEKGGAPDYAVISTSRLWLIELKTEVASHRATQIPSYFELGRHHFPAHRVDLTYLTPPFDYTPAPPPANSRFAHVTWDQVVTLVLEVWKDADGVAGDLRDTLAEAIGGIGTPWGDWRRVTLEDLLAAALRLAHQTVLDGKQRALDAGSGSLEELQQLRLDTRDALRGGVEPTDELVTPWLWNAQTSGGSPLTDAGAEQGYELRFSRARSGGRTAGGQ